MFFLHAVQIPLHFYHFHLLVFELLGAVLISAVLPPILFFSFCCFLGMCAIHNSFFFFSTIFHKHSCIPFYVPFVFFPTLPLLLLSTSVFLFLFQSLFAKLFVGCQSYTGPPPLPVASYTGLPFINSGWLHRIPIHHLWLDTQGNHPLPVVSYTGFSFIVSG